MKRLMTLRLLIFMVAYAPLQAIAQQAQQPTTPPPYYGPGPWHMWAYGGGWHFWWMFPMMLIFFLIVCGVLIMLARSAFGPSGPFRGDHGWHMPDRFPGDATRSALQILNERFARGEIQKEEYAEKKATLLSGGEPRDRTAA